MGSNQKQRVLVVDDEEDIIEILTYNLEKEGYEVNSAMMLERMTISSNP